jgi:rhamnosyl/mannosyltransferase
VATEIRGSGVSWVNEHEITGFNVPIRSSIQLAEKINLLLRDEKLYNIMSTNSRKRYHEKFTSQVMLKHFVELYETVISKKKDHTQFSSRK